MAKGSRWETEPAATPAPPPPKTPGSEGIAMPPAALELKDATIERNVLGHYYIVGYLPGDIRVAGWLHERPLGTATEGENGSPS